MVSITIERVAIVALLVIPCAYAFWRVHFAIAYILSTIGLN